MNTNDLKVAANLYNEYADAALALHRLPSKEEMMQHLREQPEALRITYHNGADSLSCDLPQYELESYAGALRSALQSKVDDLRFKLGLMGVSVGDFDPAAYHDAIYGREPMVTMDAEESWADSAKSLHS